MSTLLEIPELPLTLILEHSDVRSIQALRKACRGFRNFIDYIPLDPKTTEIKVDVYSKVISLKFLDSNSRRIRTLIEYQKFSNGCLVVTFDKVGRRSKFIKDERFEEVLCQDFDVILKHQKLPIRELQLIFWHAPPDSRYGRDLKLKKVARLFFEHLKTVLESRSRQLPRYRIQPGTLKKLMIVNGRWRKNRGHFISTTEVVYLEQWRKAEELWLPCFHVKIPMEDLYHASRIHVHFEELSAKDLYQLKEAFLNFSKLSFAYVNYAHLKDWQNLINLLGTPFDDFEEDGSKRRRWFYRVPNNEQVALSIHFECFSLFMFEKVDISSIPLNGFEGALVHFQEE